MGALSNINALMRYLRDQAVDSTPTPTAKSLVAILRDVQTQAIGTVTAPTANSLLERAKVLGTGGAGELTPARAALLSNADVATSSRSVPSNGPTYHNVGSSSSPASGTVLADTGALAAGDYEVEATMGLEGTTGTNEIDLAWRNAANSADNKLFQATSVTTSAIYMHVRWPRVTLATNERVRVVAAVNSGNGVPVWRWSLYVRVAT
jgi:hypothetical protein